MTQTRAVPLFAISLFTLGCGDGRQGRETTAEPDAMVAELSLELAIGEDNTATEEYQFASIQSILPMLDRTLWVLDGNASEGQSPLLRRYDSNGGFVQQVGRPGSGPGEYRAPQGLALMGDGRVALRDYGFPGRITLFAPDGSVDETWTLGSYLRWPFGGVNPIQIGSDGILWLPFSGRTSRSRGSPTYVRVQPGGTLLDTVAVPAAPEIEPDRVAITDRLPEGGVSTRYFTLPFQPSGQVFWAPTGTFARVRSDEYRIEVQSPHGGPDLIFERSVERVIVSGEERASARADFLERVSAAGGPGIQPIPEIPQEKPPLKSAFFSDDGRALVWVSMPSRLLDGAWVEPIAVDVFSRDAEFMGRIVFPDPPIVSEQHLRLRGNHLWCVVRDSFDRESIRRYRVVWP